jgi:hypothetical protein
MVPPGSENKIMHTSFRIGDADRVFAVLADGAQVQMPGLGPSATISVRLAPNGVARARAVCHARNTSSPLARAEVKRSCRCESLN